MRKPLLHISTLFPLVALTATPLLSFSLLAQTANSSDPRDWGIPILPTHLFEEERPPALAPQTSITPLPSPEIPIQERPQPPLSPVETVTPLEIPPPEPKPTPPPPPPPEEPSPVIQRRQTEEAPPELGESAILFQKEREQALENRSGEERERGEVFGIRGEVNNIAITELLNFLSRISGKNFIFEEKDLQFNVSFTSQADEPIENVFALLMQQLQARNLSLIEQGNTIFIHANSEVRSPGEIVIEGQTRKPESDIITQIYKLNTLDPNKISEMIRPMLSNDALVLVLRDSNHLIVTDLRANIAKLTELIRNLDSPIGGMEIGQYVPQNGLALPLMTSTEQILRPIAQGNPFFLVPHQASNSIFVISNPYLVDRALSIMRYLDTSQGQTQILDLERFRRGREGEGAPLYVDEEALRREEEERIRRLLEQGWRYDREGNLVPPGTPLSPQARIRQDLPLGHIARTLFFIYKLQYRDGDQIVQALRQIASSLQFNGTVNQDLIDAIESVQWIESTNSLIFTGTAEALERIKELIIEIDIPLRQILLEVLILDTTISDSLTYGVDWGSRFGGGDWSGSEAFLRANSPLPNVLDATGIGETPDAINLINSTVGGYNLGIVGQNLTHCGMRFNSIGSLVTAIHQDQYIHIVMNPKILTEDNYTAELFVGTTDRFKTQTVPNEFGTVLTSNFETVDVGTTIRVTPLIGPNDIITLDIEQENTSEAPEASAVASGQQTSVDTNLFPVTSKSSTKTRVHVPDKYFIILSGNITENPMRTENRVPCLGGFPLIGAGFRQITRTDSKRNLMIFIRPEIVDTDEDYRRITQRNQDIFKERGKFIRRWTYEIDEALDWANLKRTEPNESCRKYKPIDCTECCPTK